MSKRTERYVVKRVCVRTFARANVPCQDLLSVKRIDNAPQQPNFRVQLWEPNFSYGKGVRTSAAYRCTPIVAYVKRTLIPPTHQISTQCVYPFPRHWKWVRRCVRVDSNTHMTGVKHMASWYLIHIRKFTERHSEVLEIKRGMHVCTYRRIPAVAYAKRIADGSLSIHQITNPSFCPLKVSSLSPTLEFILAWWTTSTRPWSTNRGIGMT